MTTKIILNMRHGVEGLQLLYTEGSYAVWRYRHDRTAEIEQFQDHEEAYKYYLKVMREVYKRNTQRDRELIKAHLRWDRNDRA